MVRALVMFAVWAAIGLGTPVAASAAAWTGLPPVSVARYGIGAAVSGGKLYAFGGLDGNYAQSVSEVYDPASGSWSLIRPMPVVGEDVHAATGSGGRIYVLSGGITLRSTYFWVYTPWTNRWRALAKPPRMHTGGSLVLGGDGRLYAVGGSRGNVQYPVRAVDAYSPATRSWSRVAPLPVRRDLTAGATAPDGSVVVFGGGCMPTCQDPSFRSVFSYSPTTGTWTRKAPMPVARDWAAAATGADGRIYVLGGQTPTIFASDTVQVFDPQTNTWTLGPRMLEGRTDFAAAALDNSIVAVAGWNGSALASVEQLTTG